MFANWDWNTCIISVVGFFIIWSVIVPDPISIWSVTRRNFPTILMATAIGDVILSIINLLKTDLDPLSKPKWIGALTIGVVVIILYFVIAEKRRQSGNL